MKSFRQYIIEVATEVPENPGFHHRSHTDRDGNASSHRYEYKDHDQFVHFLHQHKELSPRDGLQGKHHSYISFSVDGETHRTGRQKSIDDPTGVKSASQKLSNVSHAIGHHIDKVVKPNMKHHGEHFISYHASKDQLDNPDHKNPEARPQTYHKMAKRLMKRHGYEHHATLKEKDSGGNLRYIYKKKGKKK